MMLGQSRNIGRLGFDVVVATAIAGTLATVIGVLLDHDALISKSRSRC